MRTYIVELVTTSELDITRVDIRNMQPSFVLDALFFPGMNSNEEGGVCYVLGLRKGEGETVQYSCQLGELTGGCNQRGNDFPTQVVAVDEINR